MTRHYESNNGSPEIDGEYPTNAPRDFHLWNLIDTVLLPPSMQYYRATLLRNDTGLSMQLVEVQSPPNVIGWRDERIGTRNGKIIDEFYLPPCDKHYRVSLVRWGDQYRMGSDMIMQPQETLFHYDYTTGKYVLNEPIPDITT